jgi:hypothetical protein
MFFFLAIAKRSIGIDAILNLKNTKETGLRPLFKPNVTAGKEVPHKKAVVSVSSTAPVFSNAQPIVVDEINLRGKKSNVYFPLNDS